MEHIYTMSMLLLLIGSYWGSIFYFLLITKVSFTLLYLRLNQLIGLFDFENVHGYLFIIYDNLIIFMISPSIILLTLDIFSRDKLRASRSAISAADIANEFTLGVPGEPFSFTQCSNKVTAADASGLTGEISQLEEFIREHVKQ